MFAHWSVSFSNEAQTLYEKEKKVTYVSVFKKEGKLHQEEVMTQDEINNLIARFIKVNQLLSQLIK